VDLLWLADAFGVPVVVAVGVWLLLRDLPTVLLGDAVGRGLTVSVAQNDVRLGDGVLGRVAVGNLLRLGDARGDMVGVGLGETVAVLLGQGQMAGGSCPLAKMTEDAMVSPDRYEGAVPVSCVVSNAQEISETVNAESTVNMACVAGMIVVRILQYRSV
jgi:hypothetical protein